MPRSQHSPYRPGPGGPGGSAGGPDGGRRRPSRLAAAVAVLALAGGAWLVHEGTRTERPPAPSPSDALTGHNAGGSQSSSVPAPGRGALPVSVPARIRIPAIRVNAPVTALGVDAKNEIEVPPATDRNLAGWFKYGATPGSRGAAVMLGHVDTDKGPAVFYNLGSLHKGNLVEITREDGRTAVFTIYGIEVYQKADFPTDRVYDDTPTPELRVITCGGGFSKTSHSYLGNVVVYARLTSVRAGGAAPSPSASATASSPASAPAAPASTAPAAAGTGGSTAAAARPATGKPSTPVSAAARVPVPVVRPLSPVPGVPASLQPSA